MEREFFAADVEGIERIGAVGAVFEQVFFGLGELFAGLILAEAVATVGDTGGLDSKDKVFVIRAVEERHKLLLLGEGVVDEKTLLVVVHRVYLTLSLLLSMRRFSIPRHTDSTRQPRRTNSLTTLCGSPGR